jgi:alcohol dehydrogenase (cytochrome c)
MNCNSFLSAKKHMPAKTVSLPAAKAPKHMASVYRIMGPVIVSGCVLFAAMAQEKTAVTISASIDVQPAHLLVQPPGANWISYNGDYSGRRFSSLAQITPANVEHLRAQWVFHVREADALEVTPVVVDGVMFVTSANDAFALDARTGRSIWQYSGRVTEGLIDDASQHHSRGVALWHSRVLLETDNAHLLCLDARSGHLIWDVPYAEGNKNYGATSAPLVVRDKVIVGTSGGDDGVRGFLAAYDAETGKQAWRFWTIPAPGQFGSASWPGQLYLRGGGTTWMPGTFDPDLNLLYWGTSNPAPDFDGGPRPGDDLYTDCVLALHPDTGELKWYFQFTPHDLFDYDATETPVLLDVSYDGQPRKLLVQANRNGFLYVPDRVNGKFLSAVPFIKRLNWAKAITAEGRPKRTGIQPTPEGTQICPGFSGATNWYSPAYNPDSHLFYFLALDDCATFFLKPEKFSEGRPYYATGVRRVQGTQREKILMAYNLDTRSFEWSYPQTGEGDSSGGVMTTAGDLVFFGDDSESFEAVDAKSGKPLWHFNTGQKFHASPMSYAVLGKQYVAIAAGSDIFSFALP